VDLTLTQRSRILALAAAASLCALAACGSGDAQRPADIPTVQPFTVTEVAGGLRAPWGMAFLPDGTALVSERDNGAILRVTPAGDMTTIALLAGVRPGGEGGLLGIALNPAGDAVYAYLTADVDNRVVRMTWDGAALGEPEEVLTGIPKANIHNGGRITFGPDGMLYVATGDAAVPEAAQDATTLAGKILRITEGGEAAPGNPVPGSPIYSLGHRNVQGLAFDAEGRLWASEFGSSKADELNEIVAGGNYGWPAVEGRGGAESGYVDPVTTWEPTSLASPSGIAVAGDDVYVASLRGKVLWQVSPESPSTPSVVELGDLGRLRTIERAPDGSLWLTTSNTDGRGEPKDGDDRVLRLTPTA
jgi:glucose/arabinose dehydrogenase